MGFIFSQLSRCSTARGAISGSLLGGPTKVKARKSFLFTEGSYPVTRSDIFAGLACMYTLPVMTNTYATM